jgi:hypothetical protein
VVAVAVVVYLVQTTHINLKTLVAVTVALVLLFSDGLNVTIIAVT